jgi:hypothetical protein
MNTELSPKKAKEILSLLKEGFNLTPPVQPAKPGMAPDYLGGAGAGGKAVVDGLKGLGQDIASGAASVAKGVGNAVSGAANAVGKGFNKLMTPPAGNPNAMAQATAGMAGVRIPSAPSMAQAAPVKPKAQSAAMTPVGPWEKGPTPMAPQPEGSQSLSTAPITPVPVSKGVENPAMQMKPPTLADRGVTPKTPAAPAGPTFSGDVTDQERQLLRKLHASNYNPNSKRDQQMLEHLRSAGREAGGYGDFKALKNLAYANQYGAKSDYGMLAQKWRDSRAQQLANAGGMAPKAGEYTVLTRRNTGVTTTEGNVWINPADAEWLSKSAAYSDISWEDYCGLMPSDEPESIETFFNR